MRSILGKLKRSLEGKYHNLTQPYLNPPQNVNSITLGKSVSGLPITAYRIGHGKRAVLFAGGMHGNETGSIKLTQHLLQYVHEHQVRYKELSIFFIPVLNPDGFENAKQNPDYWNGGRVGRLNDNQVDLNRNFPVASWHPDGIWSSGKAYSTKTPVSAGASPGSEPENQALRNFILNTKITSVCVFHTAGADLISSTDQTGQDLANLYVKHTGFKYFSDQMWLDLNQTGHMKEWCEDNNISFIEIEGRTRWGSDWKHQKSALESVLNYLNHLP